MAGCRKGMRRRWLNRVGGLCRHGLAGRGSIEWEGCAGRGWQSGKGCADRGWQSGRVVQTGAGRGGDAWLGCAGCARGFREAEWKADFKMGGLTSIWEVRLHTKVCRSLFARRVRTMWTTELAFLPSHARAGQAGRAGGGGGAPPASPAGAHWAGAGWGGCALGRGRLGRAPPRARAQLNKRVSRACARSCTSTSEPSKHR